MAFISGVLPVKNASHWLFQSLPSILSCLGAHDELIIVDDNSTDGSWEIIESFAIKDNRIKMFKNPSDGLVDALNFGINVATQELIARFDADDLYHNTRLQKQLALIEDGFSLVFCDYAFIDDTSRYLGRLVAPSNTFRAYVSFAASRRTPHPGAMFTREVFLAAGGYRSEDFPNEDLSLWIRIANIGLVAAAPQTLLYYRLHQSSITAEKRTSSLLGRRKIINRYFSKSRYYELRNYREICGSVRQEENRIWEILILNFLDSIKLASTLCFKPYLLMQMLKDFLALTKHPREALKTMHRLIREKLLRSSVR